VEKVYAHRTIPSGKRVGALEAYRSERISRSKLVELARLVNVSREAVERLIDESGIEPDRDPDAPASGG
jgi:hypothetical protein